MREALIELDGTLETGRCAIGPAARDLRARLAVERRVHFDRVEVLGVERELVEAFRPRLRIEHPVPRPLARLVVPSRCSHADVRAWRTSPCRIRRRPSIP